MLTSQTALEYTIANVPNSKLVNHMKIVGQCLYWYAQKLKYYEVTIPVATESEIEKINPENWKIAGILHDADWETHPDLHPATIVAHLKEIGMDDEIVNAIHSHANTSWAETQEGGNNAVVTLNGESTTIPRVIERKTLLDRMLFAVDEMSGIIFASSLMKPDHLDTLEASSVLKKIKDKGFAKGVSREDLVQGCEEIEVSMEEHITNMIHAMREIRDEIYI